ncbi:MULTISPECIES: cation-translocating P-type ATPase [unclassified Ruminococcus]|uniref:cation-translocating P-type ATPase n=1 Tax=unclassified Ruminococcus TaxID=2608920 RepID=UPI00210CCBE8|nr:MULTISPECIES: cation-translocating P-type ATPase [unclassified Ruminococcus]MCQ4021578.1 HAD-IC family P-type ATPase [Ruminococcus sp. zg-924]MCQ4114023.1 HAD-IC family P-type ATPase [Ruminococcus sp. zg-921]
MNNEASLPERLNPTAKDGLTAEQVECRLREGLYNKESTLPTKSIPRIFADNICTLFNLINIILAIAVLLVGSYKNMLFMVVILANIAIGIFQEIRAKRTVDRLSIINQAKVKSVRNGKIQEISINDIVLDDIIELSSGNQVPTDCIVMNSEVDVNESLLTGESEPIHKKPGDTLLSGSFIVSGRCRCKAEHIGNDNYASTVFSGAKYVKKVNSEIMRTLNRIIKIISIAIFPIGLLLSFNQFFQNNGNIQETVTHVVAALVGMIPEGLILLTSTVLAVGVIRLSRHNVLVQELYCIETLARVDVLCLDKTGTITEGNMVVHKAIPINGTTDEEFKDALNALTASLNDDNPTYNAVKAMFNGTSNKTAVKIHPFSSAKKWSGAYFGNDGSLVFGAAEFIFKDIIPESVSESIKEYSNGYRVLAVAHSASDFNGESLPDKLEPIGVLVIKDKVRDSAHDTLEFFASQGVELKIISGDNVHTVASIAKEAGLKNYDKYIDASTLKTDEDIKEAILKYSVFGRVTPDQKKAFVLALKEAGHTVAMTGDGVNDVLALKEADCSVAMASGSEAARNVSQLVLMDSDFSSMPRVVAEGRRSINNIQRSASLFIVKTIYSSILSLLFVFLPLSYPIEPIQMTLVSAFAIGLPSFVLALEPNHERVKGNFFINVISRALPCALVVILMTVANVILHITFGTTDIEYSTLQVVILSIAGIMLITKISIPFNAIRTALITVCAGGLALGITVFGWFFGTNPFSVRMLILISVITALSAVLFVVFNKTADKMKLHKMIKIEI